MTSISALGPAPQITPVLGTDGGESLEDGAVSTPVRRELVFCFFLAGVTSISALGPAPQITPVLGTGGGESLEDGAVSMSARREELAFCFFLAGATLRGAAGALRFLGAIAVHVNSRKFPRQKDRGLFTKTGWGGGKFVNPKKI